MNRTEYGWAWFDSFNQPDLQAGFNPVVDPEVAIAFARCFGSDDGARVLKHLRALTLGRALGPGASDATLRHLEGQRSLVLYLASMIARGSGAYAAADNGMPVPDPLPGAAEP
jgi:hypothetical protein